MTRLAALVADAAAGRFPPPDLATELVPRPEGPVSAVLGFTAHHLVAADVDRPWLDAHRDHADLGSVLRAPFLAALGERIGAVPGHLDAVLVAPAAGGPTATRLDPLATGPDAHPRVRRALAYRQDVRAAATTDGSGLVVVGRGLAGRWEVALEVGPDARGRGLGRQLAAAAAGLVPPGQPVFAQVSPGNVASLRIFLAAGYVPVGSEVLLHHGGWSHG